MKMGRKVREDGLDGIDIRALVSFFGPEVFDDGKISVNGQEIPAIILNRYRQKVSREFIFICFLPESAIFPAKRISWIFIRGYLGNQLCRCRY